jgi:dipeptidyl aminopeptidase/acylaminoacyl peptidase
MSICAYSLAIGKVVEICDYPGIESALSCSPDGERIIFASTSSHLDAYRPRGATDIIEYNLSQRAFSTIFEHPAQENDPVYSPDGTRIAFTSHRNHFNEDDFQRAFNEYRQIVMEGSNAEARAAIQKLKSFQGDSDVYVASSDGTNLIMLTNDHHVDRGVCWSPCSNYLMYSSHAERGEGTDRLHLINALNGELVPFDYDRSPLERDMGVSKVLNRTWMQRLTPDMVERMFLQPNFLGAERHPDWTK